MRVLITGGAGFIGSHIADALSNDHDVSVLDNLSSGHPENLSGEVEFFDVDICDGASVRSIIGRVAPDVVYHEAAQVSISRSMRDPVFDAEINTCGLLNVLTAAAEQKASRFIFASSGSALYGETSFAVGEDHPQHPVTAYGISKQVGERYVELFSATHGMTTVALRYSNVYGPRQDLHGETSVVAVFTRMLMMGESPTIHGDGGCVRDYVHVSDVVAANVAALTAPVTGASVFNVGTGIGTDVNTLAGYVHGACTRAVPGHDGNWHLPEFQYGPERLGDLRSNIISPAKASVQLSWQPTTALAEGIEATVKSLAPQQALVMSGSS